MAYLSPLRCMCSHQKSCAREIFFSHGYCLSQNANNHYSSYNVAIRVLADVKHYVRAKAQCRHPRPRGCEALRNGKSKMK